MLQHQIESSVTGQQRFCENQRQHQRVTPSSGSLVHCGGMYFALLFSFTGCMRQPQLGLPDASVPIQNELLQEPPAEGKPPASAPSPVWQPSGDWTRQRLIVLVETGPCLIDLSISLAGQSLEQAAAEQFDVVSKELLAELEQPAKWENLLQLPLVRSGWLGNLLPEEEQREQVISLYDTLRDGLVADDELPAFLTRGLARRAPLQVSDVGYAPDHDPGQSPWGKGDGNQDHSLDKADRDQFAATIKQQDLNADGLLSRGELLHGENGPAPKMAGRTRSSVLRATTLMLAEPASNTSTKSTRKLATDVLRHFTILAELSRAQWPDWSEALWCQFDQDNNQKVDQIELQRLVDVPPQAHLYVTLPSSGHESQQLDESDGDEARVQVQLNVPAATWTQSAAAGLLVCGNCSIRVELTDAFSQTGKLQLRQQLEQALKNPQFKAFLAQRLQLDVTAFDLLDEDRDATLSDDEFKRVWRWISCRQSSQMLGRWMLTSQPWFQLADTSADMRISMMELQAFVQGLEHFDRDGDTLLTPHELPLVATLALNRGDSRLDLPLLSSGDMSTPIVDADWFSAMDTNRDGSISPTEFLGETELFYRFDASADGFLSRGEVYFPKASN